MDEKTILFSGDDDVEMFQASIDAQETFKYFWRELSWEYRRIIPGLDLNAAKVAFETDPGQQASYEHMWVNELNFDGVMLTGTLMNDPNWIESIGAGDKVDFRFGEISDWMYSIDDKVYGAYTVNLMRSRMSPQEMRGHDEAWGLDFGDPNKIEIFYKSKPRKKGLLSMFKKDSVATDEEMMNAEHPMCLNMLDSLREQLQGSDEMLKSQDDKGNTMMHSDALAGNAPVVEILLEHGADPKQKNIHGQTVVDMANVLKWDNVLKVLQG